MTNFTFRFPEWSVHKDVREFRKEIRAKVIAKIPKEEQYELGGQLRRASTLLF